MLAYLHAVRDRIVADGRAEQVTVQASLVASRQPNSGARAVSLLSGTSRVYLQQMEERTGCAALFCNEIYVRRHTRCTLHTKVKFKTHGQPFLPFGELGRFVPRHLSASRPTVPGPWRPSST